MSYYNSRLQLALLMGSEPVPTDIVTPYVQAELIRGSVCNPYGYGVVNPYVYGYGVVNPYVYGYGVVNPYTYGYPGSPNPYYLGFYR